MSDPPVEFRRGEFVVSTNRARIGPVAADLYTGVGFSVGAGSLIYMERHP